MHKEGVLDAARALADRLSARFRVKLDDSENTPGWKFSEYEMKGVPLRVELGPSDIAEGKCVLVSRVDRSKTIVSLDGVEDAVAEKLAAIRDELYEKALANRQAHTYDCTSLEEIKQKLGENGDGFVRAMWCGDPECEDKVKELTEVGSRCIPFDQEQLSDKCVCCGRPAKKLVYWGKAY